MSRLGWHLGAFVLGALVSVGSVMVHRRAIDGVPTGLILVVVTTLMLARALRDRGDGRLASTYAFGWLVVLGYFLLGRPEGDYVIASDLRGYGLLVTGLVMVVVAIVSLGAPRRRPLA